ncbi:metallophosphoesterase [Streptomyces marianii]|uniref:Metallophosphoesterase n=1 Tax=Streptomyces marianii TaxID=1817406 RepID=A0A5R9E5C1_9ACTN|nr:metallophosphoesterase [Streptomyces marianii]TLQ44159.1 metallophosphoesterase [Streptomyces marianii]
MLVVLLVIAAVVTLLVTVHWYVWRRLVRDTTAGPGAARRAGTAAVIVLPLLTVGAFVSSRADAPFWLQQTFAWPGYLWLAALLYLTLALVAGEAVRPLLRRALARRAAGRAPGAPPTGVTDTSPPAGASANAAAQGPDSRPSGGAATAGSATVGSATVGSATVGSATVGSATAGSATAPDPASPDAGPGTTTAVAAPAQETPGGTARTDGRAPEAPGAPEAPPAGPPEDGRPAAGMSRRLFVARIVGGAAVAAAAGTVGHGTYGVLRGPSVKHVTVPLAKLARATHGYRIAVVSDIHLGPVLGRAHTQRIVDAINATQPDLVAVVGDLVDGTVADLGSAAEPLAGLRARDGSFFVTGNHEYFSGADAWVDHVRELGLTPLRNDRVEIAGFDLAGIDDVAGEREGQGPDFARALGDRDRSRAAVLLAHQPVVIHEAVRHAVDLQLSGHTHGGQLWPANYLADLANPTLAGLERYGDTQLYVTRGAGAWGPPVRVGAPSDITVVELASRET